MAVLTLVPTMAGAVPLGLRSPPPGIESKAWAEMWDRASRAAKMASKLVPGSRPECLRAVFLRLLGAMEVGASEDAASGNPGAEGIEVTVHPRNAERFNEALERERDDRCRDEGGDSGPKDMEAIARWTTNNPEWETENYGFKGKARARAKAALTEARAYLQGISHPASVKESPLELLKAGVLVPATEGAASRGLAPAGAVPAVIIPPRPLTGPLAPKVDPRQSL